MKLLETKMPENYTLETHSNFKFGGANRVRTGDLITASDALSQLSYSPSEKLSFIPININIDRILNT